MYLGSGQRLRLARRTRRALPVRFRAVLGVLALVCLAVLEYSLT